MLAAGRHGEDRLARAKRARLAERRRLKRLLKMSVVSAGIEHDGDAMSLRNEVKHCHAALLYADEVRLISPRASLLKSVADYGSMSGVDMARFIATVGPSIDPTSAPALNSILAVLGDFPRSQLAPALRKQRDALIEDLLGGFQPVQETLQQNAKDLLTRAGFEQLQIAIDDGILVIEDVHSADAADFSAEGDAMVNGLFKRIQEVLSTGNEYPLFDSDASNLVRLGVEERVFTPVPMARRLGADAAMASGLFDRLPNFPHANTREILDIRRELTDPLTRFRAGVRELTTELEVVPESEQFGNEIEDAWTLKVAPALDDIEEAIQQNTSLRDLFGKVCDDASGLAAMGAAGGVAASLAVAAGPAVSVPAVAALAVTSTVAAARAFRAQGRALRDTTETQFYFLYGANDRLGMSS